MKINNINEVIKNLDGDEISNGRIDIDSMIAILQKSGNVQKAIEDLNNVKKKTKLTFKDVYESAVLANVEGADPKDFVKALELAEKLRKDEDFSIDELKIIKDRIAKTNFIVLVKGLAIRNIEG